MIGKISPQSGNSKTGPIPVTSRPQSTCPTTCLFYDNGCYGENRGANPKTLFQLADEGSKPLSANTIIAMLAQRGSPKRFKGRELRRVLPILRDREVGDILAPDGSIDRSWLVNVTYACAKVGLTPFGYTHVPFATRTDIPVGYVMNTSCETPEDIYSSWERGLPATVVGDRDVLASLMPEARFVSCPAEDRPVTCAECGLCAKPSRMTEPRKAPVIVFKPHGRAAKKVWAAVAGRLSDTGWL